MVVSSAQLGWDFQALWNEDNPVHAYYIHPYYIQKKWFHGLYLNTFRHDKKENFPFIFLI